jgi:hypothetical protein
MIEITDFPNIGAGEGSAQRLPQGPANQGMIIRYDYSCYARVHKDLPRFVRTILVA